MAANKKILVISYHFPPDGVVGAIRPAKFAKYLKAFGWDPYVISVDQKHIEVRDSGRLDEVSDIPVVRTAAWPTVLQLGVALKNRLAGSKRRRDQDLPPSPPFGSNSDAEGGCRHEPWASRLQRYLNSIFELPDRHIGWLLPAVWRAYWLVKREGIKLVLTSAPPKTTSLIGLWLSKLVEIKLVTDLRDPWFLPEFKQADSRSLASDKIERWLEKAIVENSCCVITTTEQYRSYLQALYSRVSAERFCTIWNGYDGQDFEGIENIQPEGKFTVSYLGTFYLGRTPWEFLTALGELVKEGAIPLADLKVNFIGNVRYAEGESVEERVRSCDLAGCVNIQDPVPYRECLLSMKKSHVLLLLAPDQYYCIPAKAYEYLGAGRKILCLSREGATADLIRRTGVGMVVDPGDIIGIKVAVKELYAQYKSGENIAPMCDTSVYERKNTSKKLIEVLDAQLRSSAW